MKKSLLLEGLLLDSPMQLASKPSFICIILPANILFRQYYKTITHKLIVLSCLFNTYPDSLFAIKYFQTFIEYLNILQLPWWIRIVRRPPSRWQPICRSLAVPGGRGPLDSASTTLSRPTPSSCTPLTYARTRWLALHLGRFH